MNGGNEGPEPGTPEFEKWLQEEVQRAQAARQERIRAEQEESARLRKQKFRIVQSHVRRGLWGDICPLCIEAILAEDLSRCCAAERRKIEHWLK